MEDIELVFLTGDRLCVTINESSTVQEVINIALSQRTPPPNRQLQLLNGEQKLQPSWLVFPWAGQELMALWACAELSDDAAALLRSGTVLDPHEDTIEAIEVNAEIEPDYVYYAMRGKVAPRDRTQALAEMLMAMQPQILTFGIASRFRVLHFEGWSNLASFLTSDLWAVKQVRPFDLQPGEVAPFLSFLFRCPNLETVDLTVSKRLSAEEIKICSSRLEALVIPPSSDLLATSRRDDSELMISMAKAKIDGKQQLPDHDDDDFFAFDLLAGSATKSDESGPV
eukprot:TRINITY_DN16636_c0_g2_i1.p1 TRINITY_DN16636_c0_g2~~TRINITY_DN16636_c0_g2_i1.p1  ORF type:complete len:283 (-),score=29.13 TRINITY_DN16636_c0_g2_i1:101-949(-)